jgi:NSS family neurotransmitter:Na+ symporter
MSDVRTGSAINIEAAPASRELWGSRLGFILAAVGSAVGLGNMWGFPYRTAENGGAAFVMLYILMTLLVGGPIMIAEFGLGRSTRLSPIGALAAAGGRAWRPAGFLFVLSGLLILAYYSVIAGWVTRYAVDTMLSPFPADAAGYFAAVSSGTAAIGYHLAFMAITIFIVAGGVSKGIERLSLFMMPLLFAIVVGLAIWAAFLPGARAGHAFYLLPRFEELLSLDTLAAATSQAFFSLSLGMGAMLTFASYLSKNSSLPQEAAIISISDFSVAFFAGLVVFPVIFALSLQDAVGESTIGALFISIPGAFQAMGATGRIVGLLFFFALFIGAITSAVSLLEVVVSSAIDEWKINRKIAALVAGGLIAAIGILPARNTNVLGAMDAVATEIFLPVGGLLIAILVGWRMSDRLSAFTEGAGGAALAFFGVWRWFLRIVVPPLLLLVLYTTIPRGYNAVMAVFQAQ